MSIDLYKILGIEPKASSAEIKSAYRALVKKHHPDTGGDKNLIIGCASRSWVICHKKENLFFIEIDSEAHIVRGLLSLLQHAVNNKNSSEIINLDGNQILK